MAEDHVAKQGECVLSIAHRRGFFWETVWNHSNNAELKQLREDPNILLPGDVVHVPDITLKTESGATEAHHRFRKLGTPAKLRLRLIRARNEDGEPIDQEATEPWQAADAEAGPDEDEPRADEPYALYVDGFSVGEGKTDADGRLEAIIPPAARHGVLILNPGTPEQLALDLSLRQMDPIKELEGVCKRLTNLGFNCPHGAKELTPAIEAALRAFQRKNDLPVTGEPDEETRTALKTAHGG